MSVGQAQRQKGTSYREVEKPGAIPQLLTLTGQDISQRVRGMLIWGSILGALGALFVAVWPSFSEDTAGMEQMVSSMPPAMRELFGFGEGAFSSVEGFIGGEMLNFLVPLALAFFPILVASSVLAGAEEEGKIDVLMGNPLSRWQLVLGRFLSAAVLLLGIVTIMGLITWFTGLIVDVDLAFESMAAASLSLWALCIFFGGLALLLSAVFHRRFLALMVPASLLIVMYFVNGLAGSVEFFETIQPLSAFNYYGSAIEDGLDWGNFAVLTGSTVVLVGLAVLIFRRRDIYA
ncbi:ABC transporter permease [soil metagenome]